MRKLLFAIICISAISTASTYSQGGNVIVTLPLNQGWNWISLNLENPNMSIESVLGSLILTDGDYIKSKTVSATYYKSFGWFGELTTMDTKETYKMKLAEANVLTHEGTPPNPCHQIWVNIGWNWIGFPKLSALPIGEAMASINPVAGDYVKSQTESATYYAGFGWFGELSLMDPLKGYMLKTSHQEELLFPHNEIETFTDVRDGHEYRLIRIGTQTWMAENLAWLPSVSPSSDGSLILLKYYVYGYEGRGSVTAAKATDNYSKYGVLYNRPAAISACPNGWHLPSDEEWKTMEKYLGMNSTDAADIEWRNSGFVGRKLKSTSDWYNDGNGINCSGFKALAGGTRRPDGFYSLDEFGHFWSSSLNGPLGWYRSLGYEENGMWRASYHRSSGYSVRCLRDW